MMTSKARRPASAIADIRERIRTEGAEAAFEALMQVCRDPNAPAQAKATAGSTLFRSAGLMEKHDDDLDDKPLEEMTFAELQKVVLQGAQAANAPDELVDAVERIGLASPVAIAPPAAPARPVEPAPARRRRRTAAEAGKPAAGTRSPLDDFG